MKSRCCTGCLVLVILGVAGGLFAYRQAVTPPRLAGVEEWSRLSSAEKDRRRKAADDLKKSIRELGKTSPAAGQNFRLAITQEQLNTLLQDIPAARSAQGLSNPRLALRSGRVEIQGDVEYQQMRTTVTVYGSPRVVNGDPELKVTELYVGGLPAPSGLRRQAESAADRQFKRLLGRYPVRLNRITVEDGKMVLEGARKNGIQRNSGQ